MTLQIEVTQCNITSGIRHAPFHCPVALAVKQQLPPGSYVYVSRATLIVALPGCDYQLWELPNAVREFVQHFDACHTVAPISFEVCLGD